MRRSPTRLFVMLSLALWCMPMLTSAQASEEGAAIGRLSYRLSDGWEAWPQDKREAIVRAMDEAVSLYNRHARFEKEIRVTYSPDTPTADANYNGHIRFGGSINARVALHEVGHTLGIGTTGQWQELIKDGKWTGPRAKALLKSFDGPDAVLKGDRQHFWPYGLNYDREDGPDQRVRHIQMVEALCRDMDLPVFVPERDAAATTAGRTYDAFHPAAPRWQDTDGEHIQAHGGGVLLHDGVYYWYGEQRGVGRAGMRCYSSTDLYNWQPHGVVLDTSEDEGTDLKPRCTIERPKVIYNEKTGKFVMWFHLELEGIGYWAARTGVAIADSPTGPFTYLRSFRPHPGLIPVNAPIGSVHEHRRWREMIQEAPEGHERRVAGEVFMRDLGVGQMARDMTLFQDDDGTAYHIHSSEENATLHIARLTDDYLNFSGEFARVQPDGRNEAPAVFKHEGRYYMIASGLTGWAPNEARSFVADSMLGPWEPLGNPCVGGPNTHDGIGADKTFGGQSTFVFPAPGYEGQGKFIAMFDVWQPRDLKTSRYLWLPLVIKDGKPVIEWQQAWKVTDFGKAVSGGENRRGLRR